MMEILLVVIVIMVGILVYAGITMFLPQMGKDTSHAKNILKELYKTNQSETQNTEEKNILQNTLEQDTAFVRFFYGLPGMGKIYQLAMQAGYSEKLEVTIIQLVVATLVCVFIIGILGSSPALMLFTPLFGYLIIKIWLEKKVEKRNQQFLSIFPDALDMIVRSVKSGFPLNNAVRMVADNIENPVKEEFQTVNDEIVLGRPINEAMQRLAIRINEPDIHFFVVVLYVQQETGGNLAEVISSLSKVIRKRRQLRLKIKAITSEGRATSYILGALPILFTGAMMAIDPNYMLPLYETFTGNVIIGLVAVLTFGCFFIIQRMVNIDI